MKRTKNPSRGVADPHAARELQLMNICSNKLRNQWDSIVANLAKKKAKRTYDKELAVKLWRYWADSAAKEYTKQFGTGSGYGVFNVPTRDLAAIQMENDYFGNVNENPSVRSGEAAYVRRPSQITKKAPTKRLKKRRVKAFRKPVKGRFPNPSVNDAYVADGSSIYGFSILRKAKKMETIRHKNPAPPGFAIFAQGTGKRMHYDGKKFSERFPKVYAVASRAEDQARAMLAKYPVLKKYRIWVGPVPPKR